MKAKADELIHEARQWTQERVLWDWDAASDELKPLLEEIRRRLFDPAFNVAALERSCRVTQRTGSLPASFVSHWICRRIATSYSGSRA